MSNKSFNVASKNRRKRISTVIQAVILLFLVITLVRVVWITERYEAADDSEYTNTDGFVALSYFGVARNESTKYVGRDTLRQQLTLLKEQGFETISQDQVTDFLEKGKPLPDKALFLSFEDGRNDSSIFAQPILEALNYRATMFTYADKMDTSDTKFLKPRDLSPMMRSGYWELGSNGYQLTYINTFNDKGEHLGVIPENDVPDKTEIEYYNHYLMDYLRDEYLISTESKREMEERITDDYARMQSIYEESFGFVPKSYAIMHANSLYNNMNEYVEAINDQNIRETFGIHFNRDRNAFNDQDSDAYDLTRIQAIPSWSVNHLLMKLKQDSPFPITFFEGDTSLASRFSTTNAVLEAAKDELIVTTYPGKEGYATLQDEVPVEATLAMRLTGAVMGEQSIVLQDADSGKSHILVFAKNTLTLYEEVNGERREVEQVALAPIKWDGTDFAFNKATQYTYEDTQAGSRIVDGEYPRTLPNDRQVELRLGTDTLNVSVDGEALISAKSDPADTFYVKLGGRALQSETGYQKDEGAIYDSSFEALRITKQDESIYDTTPTRTERMTSQVKTRWDRTVDYFIETF
ncbi:polysaccharide deacetylase family protein [Exiguobacterium mexicanum]